MQNRNWRIKKLDMIAANRVGDGLGFDSDENALDVYWPWRFTVAGNGIEGETGQAVDGNNRCALPGKISRTTTQACPERRFSLIKMTRPAVPPSIFRAYDIRGVVGQTLTADIAHRIGLGIGSEARDRGEQALIIGRDGRHSSPELAGALVAGLRESGRDVVDIDMVPTPLLYFATHWLQANSGVMVTGSHNGPEYNGVKLIIGGQTLFGDALQAIYRRIVAGEFTRGRGGLSSKQTSAPIICARITGDISPVTNGAGLKVVIDCGNGVAGDVAPATISRPGPSCRGNVLRRRWGISQPSSRPQSAGKHGTRWSPG